MARDLLCETAATSMPSADLTSLVTSALLHPVVKRSEMHRIMAATRALVLLDSLFVFIMVNFLLLLVKLTYDIECSFWDALTSDGKETLLLLDLAFLFDDIFCILARYIASKRAPSDKIF